MHLFCVGMGFVAKHLSAMLHEKSWQVSGTTRSGTSDAGFATIHPFDGVKPLAIESDETVTHLLLSTPPTEEGDRFYNAHPKLVTPFPNLEWIGYLSTTGVYGNTDGAWVDETSPLAPTHHWAENRVKAEQQWLTYHDEHDVAVHIFRLPGIYGKGRSVLESLKNGTAKRIARENQFFSRMHVEDIANVLAASIAKPHAGQVYNVADDYPCAQEEVVTYGAELLEMEPPPLIPLEEANLSPFGKAFYQNSRKVSNTRIKEELGITLCYPTYREGLKACLMHFDVV